MVFLRYFGTLNVVLNETMTHKRCYFAINIFFSIKTKTRIKTFTVLSVKTHVYKPEIPRMKLLNADKIYVDFE